MKLAYLINQYPMASLTFIRREIDAMEQMGNHVARFAIQPWSEKLVDEADKKEGQLTRYLKAGGAIALALALFATAARRPILFFRALRTSVDIARHSDRSWPYHLAYLAEACRLRNWLVAEYIEHLHIHFATNSTEVGLLCRILGGPPYSFTVHGPEEFDRAICQSLPIKVEHAEFVVSISSFCRSQLYRWVPARFWSKIKIVRCGIDSQFLSSNHESRICGNVKLVCVGRLCEQKGQLLLIEAVGRLASTGTCFELTLVGDGPMRSECETSITQLGLKQSVSITGWATGDQVRAELESSTIFVLPSFAEGLPVVIMEAMAMGRPIISTYVAGIPELVRTGVSGWLVPAGDVDALAAAIKEAVNLSPRTLEKMGQQGREAVLARHDINVESQKLKELFLNSSKRNSRSLPD